MEVTVLGSGDALGMPVPLCGCDYCRNGPRRRRPALLVEDGGATVVLDAGPDLAEQLRMMGVTALDAVFVTHHHYDHVGGLWELFHAGLTLEDHVMDPTVYEDAGPPQSEVPVYLTACAVDHLREQQEALTSVLAEDRLVPGTPHEFGDLTVTPFPVDHARPEFQTQGFRVESETGTVVYAPDLRDWLPNHESGDLYAGADLLVVEGAGFFRADPHGPGDRLAAAVDNAAAARTVLVNISEHLHRQSTTTLREHATDLGYDLGADGAQYSV